MKSAEEWARDTFFQMPYIDDIDPYYKPIAGDSNLLKAISEIQLDAMKEGMQRASDLNVPFTLPTGYTGTRQVLGIHFTLGHDHGVADCRLGIRCAADALTEKEL